MLDFNNITISDSTRLDMNELIEAGKNKLLLVSKRIKLYQIIEKEIMLGGGRDFIKSGETTRVTAARLAGFSSHNPAYWGTIVLKHGIPELIKRMDLDHNNGMKLSTNSARAIAKETPEEQKRILDMSRLGIREWIKSRNNKSANNTKIIIKVEKTKRIDPPYLPLILPSSEEIEAPPPDATWAERSAWRDKVGSKVVVHPLRIKQLQTDEAGVDQLMTPLKVLLRDDTPTAEEFAASIERMLQHAHKPDALEPGDRINYANKARDARFWLKKNIDLVTSKLEAYREMYARISELKGVDNLQEP